MESILANDWKDRRPEGYDVVVIGSGYGGSITAARLANADANPRLKVCILERGQEWPVGRFPDELAALLGATYNNVFNPIGLYEFAPFRDIAVIKGSGLGGTSLVNANVAIRPEPDTFTDWPSALNQAAQLGEDTPGSLWNYYKLAEETLDVSPHPSGGTLKKIQALQKRASELNPPRAVESLRLAVNFDKEGVEVYNDGNGRRIVKHKCIDCGDCVTGCNVGAKNTLYMNYLPLAKRGGAHIFTQTEVDSVEPAADGGWMVHIAHRDNNLFRTQGTIRARIVILAAGALGSPKILLKSQQQGLRTGVGVGTRFGGNGDFFGLAYNSEQITNIIGWGNHPEDPISQIVRPGPTIVGLVRYNEKLPVGQRFAIEDVSIPRAYRDAAAVGFRVIPGVDAGIRNLDAAQQRLDQDAFGADPRGATNSTMLYLCTAHDDSGGSMYLDALGNLQIDWLGAGGEDIFRQINEECLAHAKALGSSFIANPLWHVSPWKTLLTAHPLGGCPMGEDGSDGAVDHLGRVFSGVGIDVHDGLYVADGSIVRTALGVNPFLTISALSERIADHIIRRVKGLSDEEAVSRIVVTGVKDLDPVKVIDYREDQLEEVFAQTTTLPVQKLVNTGQVAIDWENRRIDNDESWKGFFPKGSALNTLSSLLFAGFKKTFAAEGSTVSGVTSDSDGRINARNVLKEIALDAPQGNLETGRYIVLQYPDPPWQLYYDVLKVVSDDLLIGRAYFGVFPDGIKIMTFPMTRTYDFDHMGVKDFQRIYSQYATPPDPAKLQGVWDMNVIANSNHSRVVARLAFDRKPDGTFQAHFQFLNIIQGISISKFTSDDLRLYDFTPLHDEIRAVASDYLVGKWISDDMRAFGPFATNSLGLIQTEVQPDGSQRLGFYYTLTRSSAAGLAPPLLVDRILSEPVGAGLSFQEEMVGDFYPGVTVPNDRDIGTLLQTQGRGVPCSFQLKMLIPNIDDFVADANHRAQPTGTVSFGQFAGVQNATCPVKPDPSNTFFDYLRLNPQTQQTEIRYSLKFTGGDGKTYLLWGLKFMQRDSGSIQDILNDYTTLYTRIFQLDGAGNGQQEVGVALLKFRTFEDVSSVASFLRFFESYEVVGTDDLLKQVQVRNKFNIFTLNFIFYEYDPLGSGLMSASAAAGGQRR